MERRRVRECLSRIVCAVALISLSVNSALAQMEFGVYDIELKFEKLPKATKEKALLIPQESQAPPSLNFVNYGVENGLPISSVYSSLLDRRGNLWFGTLGGGVVSFDGSKFVTYNLSNGLSGNVVRAILEDKSGVFWFGTEFGISRYDGYKIEKFGDSRLNVSVSALEEDEEGNIWIGTFGRGLFKFNGEELLQITSEDGLASEIVRSIHWDKSGILLVGTTLGLSVIDRNNKVVSNPLSEKIGETIVYCIAEDANGGKWFGTSTGLHFVNNGQYKNYTNVDGLPDLAVLTLTTVEDGLLWLGTRDGGVASFDGENFEVIDVSTGLSNNHVYSITEDREGYLWFSTYGGGICRYRRGVTKMFGKAQGLSNQNVWAIEEDQGGYVWFGTDDGIYRFDGKQFEELYISGGINRRIINCISVGPDNSIWIGTREGLICYDGLTISRCFSSQNADSDIRSVLVSKDNLVWVRTSNESYVLKGDSIAIFNQASDLKITLKEPSSISIGRNDSWVHSSSSFINIDTKSIILYELEQSKKKIQLRHILRDYSGHFWFGSYNNGIFRLDGESLSNFSFNEGIPDLHVYDIAQDDSGGIWFGCNLGIVKLSFRLGSELREAGYISASNAVLSKDYIPVWNLFGRQSGFPFEDMNYSAFLFASQGTPKNNAENKNVLWAGFGNRVVARINPQKVSEVPAVPEAAIKGVMINNQVVPWASLNQVNSFTPDSIARSQSEALFLRQILSDSSRISLFAQFEGITFDSLTPYTNIPFNLKLPYKNNHITFHFGTINTVLGDQTIFEYMLQGQDKKWKTVGNINELTFNNLWEGQYTFKLRSKFANSQWGPVVSYSFTVQPPLIRTWYMILIYISAFVVSIIGFNRAQKRKLKLENRRLEDLVTMRTKEVVRQREEAVEGKAMVEELNEELRMQLQQAERTLSLQALQMVNTSNDLNVLEIEIKRNRGQLEPQKLLRIIRSKKMMDSEWDNFKYYFGNVHKHFFDKLEASSPDLSVHEQRMCALIRLRMQNKEISSLLNIEQSSVRMAKYRIKKKLNLDESTDLAQFLSSLD